MTKITIGGLRRIIKEEIQEALTGASDRLDKLNKELGGDDEDLKKSDPRAFMKRGGGLDPENANHMRAAGPLGDYFKKWSAVVSRQKGVKGIGGSNYWYTLYPDYHNGKEVFDYAMFEHNSYDSKYELVAYSTKDGKVFRIPNRNGLGSKAPVEMKGNPDRWESP